MDDVATVLEEHSLDVASLVLLDHDRSAAHERNSARDDPVDEVLVRARWPRHRCMSWSEIEVSHGDLTRDRVSQLAHVSRPRERFPASKHVGLDTSLVAPKMPPEMRRELADVRAAVA